MEYNNFIDDIPGLEEKMLGFWNDAIPFKCIFGFAGDINDKWENELNQMVAEDRSVKSGLPDLIIVNKKGMIAKLNGPTQSSNGNIIDKDFHFTRFVNYKNYGAPMIMIAQTLFGLGDWQNRLITRYGEYFKKDLLF